MLNVFLWILGVGSFVSLLLFVNLVGVYWLRLKRAKIRFSMMDLLRCWSKMRVSEAAVLAKIGNLEIPFRELVSYESKGQNSFEFVMQQVLDQASKHKNTDDQENGE